MVKTLTNRLKAHALYLPFIVCFLLSIQAQGQGTSTIQSENTPRTAVEVMPVFPGGDEALMKFISKNLHYPISAKFAGIEGRVTTRFIVDRDGSISNIEVIKSINPAFDQEVVRVFKAMPKWRPGRERGINVPVYYTIPTLFKLNGENPPKLPKQPKQPKEPAPLTLIQIKNGQSITTPNAATKEDLPLIVVDTKPYQIEGLDLTKAPDDEIFKALSLKLENVESTYVIKGKTAVKRYGERGKDGVIQIIMKEALSVAPVSSPDIMPVFPGGDDALIQFISRNLKYPQSAMEQGIEGLVSVRFVIDTDGRAKMFEVLKGVTPDLDEAAIQSLRKMPKWKPAQKEGINVPSYWVMPILFRLNR